MLPEIIETERLVLRPWDFGDLADAFAYAQDDEWSRYLPVPRPYYERDAKTFIARQILLEREQHPSWVLEFGGRNVGGINVRFSSEHRIGEMGYSLARPLWGRGLVTEAARAVIDAAFRTYPELVRVRAMADARNVASRRVLEKCGMTCEGVLRSNRIHHGEPVDEAWHGILRSEWEKGAR